MAFQPSEEAFRRMLEEMRPLFWDTDVQALDRDRNAPYIIVRLLNLGGMRGYIWTVDLFTEQQIADAVIRRRDLRPVVRSFMARRLNIPQERLVQTPSWRERMYEKI